jgi:hypothetical protein
VLRIGIGRMDSGLREGAGTGTGTGVRVGARVTCGIDTGVTRVGTGSVGAWRAVSYVLLRERLLEIIDRAQ